MPIRVPITETPSVASSATQLPTEQGHVSQGLGMVGQGLEQFGQGVGQVAKVANDVIAKAKQKADAIAENDALADFERATTARLYGDNQPHPDGILRPLGAEAKPGFLQTRGQEAFAQSAPTLQTLEQDRQKIAERLSTEEQKQSYLAKSRGMYEGARRQVEGHASSQLQVASDASVRARVAASLDGIANRYTDSGYAEGQMAAVEEGLKTLAVSPEDAAQRIAIYRESVASTRLNKYIDARDWRGAADVLAIHGAELGDNRKHYAKIVDDMRTAYESVEVADKLIEGARNEAGHVSMTRALEGLDKVPQKLKDAVDKRVKVRLLEEDKVWKERQAVYFDEAQATVDQYHTTAAVDPRTKAWMQENDAPGWHRLVRQEQSYLDAAAARARGESHRDTPDQAEALVSVMTDMRENPDKYASMDVKEFTRQWKSQLSDAGYKQAGARFAVGSKADQVNAAAFAKDLQNDIKSTPALARNKKDAAAYGAVLDAERLKFINEKKREPTLDEWTNIKAAAHLKVTRDREFLGIKLGTTEEEAWQAAARAKKAGKTADLTVPHVRPPGRYKNKAGKFFTIDENGKATYE